MGFVKFVASSLVVAALSACSPELDWREVRAEGSGIAASFPCKPDRHARDVRLAGADLRLDMLVCRAGETTFALAFAVVADPARVTATLAELRAVAAANLGAPAASAAALQVPGMTPNEQASRLVLFGRAPDGAVLQEQLAVFTRGLRIYQATVLGTHPPPGAADAFFAGLRFES